MRIPPEKVVDLLNGSAGGPPDGDRGRPGELALTRRQIARGLGIDERNDEFRELIRAMTSAGYLIRKRREGHLVYVLGRSLDAGPSRPQRVDEDEYRRGVEWLASRQPQGARPGGTTPAPAAPAGPGYGPIHEASGREPEHTTLCGVSFAQMPNFLPLIADYDGPLRSRETWTTIPESVTCGACIARRGTPRGARPGPRVPAQRDPFGHPIGDGALHGAVQRAEALCGLSIANMPAVGPPGSPGWTTDLEMINCPGCVHARETRRPAPASSGIFFPAPSVNRHGRLPGVTALTACGEPIATLPAGEYVAEGDLITPSCQPCIHEMSTHAGEVEHRREAAEDLAAGIPVHLVQGGPRAAELMCGLPRLDLPDEHRTTYYPSRANCAACIAALGAATGYPQDAYAQGRHDQAAGTIDTTRTADRGYVQGLSDERAAQLERDLAQLAAVEAEYDGRCTFNGPFSSEHVYVHDPAAVAESRAGNGGIDEWERCNKLRTDVIHPGEPEADAAWLAELFEYERCHECGQDADRHRVTVTAVGHRFAQCLDGETSPGPDASTGAPAEEPNAWPPSQADEPEVHRRHDAIRAQGLPTGYDANPGDLVVHVELGVRGDFVSRDGECAYVRYADTTDEAGDLTHAGDVVVIERRRRVSATGPAELDSINVHEHVFIDPVDVNNLPEDGRRSYYRGRDDYAHERVDLDRYEADPLYARGVRDCYAAERLGHWQAEQQPTGWTPPEPGWRSSTFEGMPPSTRDEAEEAWRHRVERIDYWRRNGRLTDVEATALLDASSPVSVIGDEESYRRNGTSGRFDPGYVDAVEQLSLDADIGDGSCRYCRGSLGHEHTIRTGPDGAPVMEHPPWDYAEGRGTLYPSQGGVDQLVPGDPVRIGSQNGIFEYVDDDGVTALVTFEGATEPTRVPKRDLRAHGANA